jgi:hypothetical protein
VAILKFTAAARARFTLYLLPCGLSLLLMWMSPSSTRQPPSSRSWTRWSHCLCTVLLPSIWSMSPVNVDVSIINKTDTLLSFMDPSVSLMLSGLASIHVVYVSPVYVDVAIIDKTATLHSSMDPPVLSIVCLTSWSLTHSQPQPEFCSHCE